MKRALVTSLLLSLGTLTAGASLTSAHAEDPIDVTPDRSPTRPASSAPTRPRSAKPSTASSTAPAFSSTWSTCRPSTTSPARNGRPGRQRSPSSDAATCCSAVATKDRSYGYDADNQTFTADDLETVDRTRILPALRNDEFAQAAIEAADGYGDIAEDDGLPWGWIVFAVVLVLAASGFVVHRVRRRFERSHHVLDEHGNPVDPAALLDIEELEEVSNRALVAVDDALLTSNDELRHAEAEHKRHQTDGFRFTVDQGRVSMREAFTLRQQLDDSSTMPDQARRRTAARIIAICEEVDRSLDAQVEAFDALRDLEQPRAAGARRPGHARRRSGSEPAHRAIRPPDGRRDGTDRTRPQGAGGRRDEERHRPRPRGGGSHRTGRTAARGPTEQALRSRQVHHDPPRSRPCTGEGAAFGGRPEPPLR